MCELYRYQNARYKVKKDKKYLLRIYFSWLDSPLSLGPLYGVPRSHSDIPHTLGFIWQSDRPDTENVTTRNLHKRQTSVTPAVFETAIPASEQALDPFRDRQL